MQGSSLSLRSWSSTFFDSIPFRDWLLHLWVALAWERGLLRFQRLWLLRVRSAFCLFQGPATPPPGGSGFVSQATPSCDGSGSSALVSHPACAGGRIVHITPRLGKLLLPFRVPEHVLHAAQLSCQQLVDAIPRSWCLFLPPQLIELVASCRVHPVWVRDWLLRPRAALVV